MTGAAALPEAAYLVALASLPEVGPARLAALLARGDPAAVLADLAAGTVEADEALAAACRRADPRPLVHAWRRAAAACDVAALWARHRDAGVAVLRPSDPGWPARLDGDPEPPAVLFCRGDPAVLDRPCVAVVGSRRCSRYGWNTAHRLGAGLARAGVCVVSGLARGIDAAAHRGALDARAAGPAAPPAGVVGTGLDVPYPRANAGLWAEVAAAGVLLGEAPLGTPPARWRFPARNRLVAALADVVVVVESAVGGGALHTVDEALRRDRPVLAVPGPIDSPVSAGTNRLLRDVAAPVCDLDDVLVALGLATAGRAAPQAGAGCEVAAAVGEGVSADAARVLEALGSTPATLDALAAATGLRLGRVAVAVAELEAAGLAATAAGAVARADRGGRFT